MDMKLHKGKAMSTAKVVRRATAGFIVSLIAGIIILINALLSVALLAEFVESFGGILPIIVTARAGF